MSEITVLVADGHDLFRVGLASMLAVAEDIDVVGQASSGGGAVRLAAELHPNVLLLALSMPDIDGPAATRQLVAQDSSVRVIVLAVTEADSDIAAALTAGACGFLLRDTPLEDVVAAIHAAASADAWLSPGAARRALERLRRSSLQRTSSDGLETDLSSRELEVLQLLARGLDDREIAAELCISPRTAKNHVSSVLRKIGRPGRRPEGSSGVREPRRPMPETGGGSARLQPPQH